MKRLSWFVASSLACLSLLLSGCIPISLRPWCADGDVIFDPALVGVYVNKSDDASVTVTFKKDGDKRYAVTQVRKAEDGSSEEFHVRARLFQLGGKRYLDFTPVDGEEVMPKAKTFPMVPGHFVIQVTQSGSRLRLAGFDFAWLDNFVKSHPKSLRVERLIFGDENETDDHANDDMVVTSSTAELRAFLKAHGTDPKAFAAPQLEQDLIRQ